MAKTMRIATFLVPSISIEFFEALSHYLEHKSKCYTTLTCESRWDGPNKDRPDIFGDEGVDLANGYLKLRDSGKPQTWELLLLSAVHIHEKAENKAGVMVDVVVNRNLRGVKEFNELRGIRWAQNVTDTLCNQLTLYQLKSIGESASFFSNILKSKSHLESLRMILQRKAHAAAVDSNAFSMFLRENPDEKNELYTFTSWGPLPPYALVINKNMPQDVLKKLTAVLLDMHNDEEGFRILSSFKIRRFDTISEDDLETGEDLFTNTKHMRFQTAYY